MSSECVHHWVLSADTTVPLAGARPRDNRYEVVIGRPGRCKRCGAERVLPERIGGGYSWKD